MGHLLNILNFKSHPLTIAMTLICGWLALYATLSQITPRDVTEYYHLRFEAIRQTIRSLDIKPPTVVFFGPSDIALNVSPVSIAPQIGNVEIYNFGVAMAGPDTVGILTRQLRDSLHKKNQKVDLAVLRFNPMMYTKRYRSIVRQAQYSLFTYKIPFATLIGYSRLHNLEFLAQALYLRLVGGGGGQGALQLKTRMFLNQSVNAQNIKLYTELWKPDILSPREDYWNREAFGEINLFGGENSLSNFVDHHAKELYLAGFGAHRYLFNALSLDFDEEFFLDLDQSINELAQVADRVAVLYIPDFIAPESPKVSSDGQSRLAARIEKLKNDPRVHFWDYSNIWQPDTTDFIDITHMTEKGKVKFNKLLAASILGEFRQEN